jgi:O-antigen/teichoic acid export membrane protein
MAGARSFPTDTTPDASGVDMSYLRNVSSMIAQFLVQRVTGSIATFVMAHLFGPSGFGQFSLISSTATAVYGVSRLGVDSGLQILMARTDVARDKDKASLLMGSGLVLLIAIGLSGAVAAIIMGGWIGEHLFGDSSVAPFVRWASVFIFCQAINQFASVSLAGLHAFSRYARVMIVQAPLSAILSILGAFTFGVWGAVAGQVAGQSLMAVHVIVALYKEARGVGVIVRPRLAWQGMTSILYLGLPLYVSGLLTIPATYFAQGLLTQSASVGVLGNLRVTMAITSIVSLLPTAVASPMLSSLARAHGEGRGFSEGLAMNLRMVWLFGLGAVAFLGLFWDDLVNILFGSDYSEAVSSGWIACVGMLITLVQGVAHTGLFAVKRSLSFFLLDAFQAIIFFSFAWRLIPEYGLSGFLGAQTIAGMIVLLSTGVFGLIIGRPDGAMLRLIGWLSLCTLVVFSAMVVRWRFAFGLTGELFLLIVCMVVLSLVSLRRIFPAEELSALQTIFYRIYSQIRRGRLRGV